MWRRDARSKGPRRGEELADQRLEVRERLGRVVGVEARLVPFVGEPSGQAVPGLALVLVAGVGILAEVLVVVLALEVLVRPDNVVGLVTDVGPQDLGGDVR